MNHRFEVWQNMREFRRGAFGHEECGHRGFGRGGEGDHHRGQDRERGGRFWHGGRGGERPFDHGELRLVVLALIAEKPRHGYEIIKAIEDRCGGSYTPSPGVVYPTLTMLEELGYVTVAEAGGKKLHTITAEGEAYLAVNRAATDAAMARMQGIGERHGGGPSPQLMRAMENFKMALRLRQRNGPLPDEQIRTIVAAIDAAAVAIERS